VFSQNNLGVALVELAAREGGTARLEEAVVAFGAALEELRPLRDPVHWMNVEQSLNAARAVLTTERELDKISGGTAGLGEAVAASPRKTPASAIRSPGQRRSTISAMRS
jgi:hypothetical protein